MDAASQQAKRQAAARTAMPPTPILESHQILTPERLRQLVRQVDPSKEIDEAVTKLLLDVADDFVASVTRSASLLATHRGSATLEVSDVQLYLEKTMNIHIPGFQPDESAP